jgi:methylmalonyl-CoA/ethylmalonyl-CoA epimerase
MAKSTAAKLNLKKIHHVGIVVRDMAATIKRLESLGIGPFEPFDPKALPRFLTEPIFRGKLMDSKQKVFNGKAGEVIFELFEPGKGNSPWKEFLDTKGEGIHHIGVYVDDLDKEIERLTKEGATIMLNGRWEGGGGGVYMDLGAGDLIIELYKP